MKVTLGCILLSATSFAALADDSCGIEVAKLMSSGKAATLANLFQGKTERTSELQQLIVKVGSLSAVEEVSGPRFQQFKRMSVGTNEPGRTAKYLGFWVNATSEKLGAIQLHVAKVPESTCSLLALHVDSVL
jgi:hypothetical protein